MTVHLYSANEVSNKFPHAWDVKGGTGYKIAHKQFGKFIATVLLIPPGRAHWRVKEINMFMGDNINDPLILKYEHKRAGQAISIIEAMNYIEKNTIPILLSLSNMKESLIDIEKNSQPVG